MKTAAADKQKYIDLVNDVQICADNLTIVPKIFAKQMKKKVSFVNSLNPAMRMVNDLWLYFPEEKIEYSTLKQIKERIEERGFNNFVDDHIVMKKNGTVTNNHINFYVTMGLLDRADLLNEAERLYLTQKVQAFIPQILEGTSNSHRKIQYLAGVSHLNNEMIEFNAKKKEYRQIIEEGAAKMNSL